MSGKSTKPLVDRFMEKTRRDPCGCLIWTGATSGKGNYGYISVGIRAEGVKRAHHVAWFIKYGVWPTYLLHGCDTPLCVETSHLSEGSNADNVADMVSKGRQAKGERNGHATLSDAQVAEIRRRVSQGATQTSVGAEFGVSSAHMSRLVNCHRRA